MYQLITTVMSIALFSATTFAAIKYTNPRLPMQQDAQEQIAEGFESLRIGWEAYRAENQTFEWRCDTLTTDQGVYESCRKEVADLGYLPVSGWSRRLFPQYAFMPRAPIGLDWSYGQNDEGWYFCAEGSINKDQLKGILRAQQRFPMESLVIANECGVTADTPAEALDLGNIKVTYWVKRAAPDPQPDAFSMILLPQGAPPAHLAMLSFFSNGSTHVKHPWKGGDAGGGSGGSDNEGNGAGGKNCNGVGNPDCGRDHPVFGDDWDKGKGKGNGKNCNGVGNPDCGRDHPVKGNGELTVAGYFGKVEAKRPGLHIQPNPGSERGPIALPTWPDIYEV